MLLSISEFFDGDITHSDLKIKSFTEIILDEFSKCSWIQIFFLYFIGNSFNVAITNIINKIPLIFESRILPLAIQTFTSTAESQVENCSLDASTKTVDGLYGMLTYAMKTASLVQNTDNTLNCMKETASNELNFFKAKLRKEFENKTTKYSFQFFQILNIAKNGSQRLLTCAGFAAARFGYTSVSNALLNNNSMIPKIDYLSRTVSKLQLSIKKMKSPLKIEDISSTTKKTASNKKAPKKVQQILKASSLSEKMQKRIETTSLYEKAPLRSQFKRRSSSNESEDQPF
jgi:hypothetical protein